MNSSLGFIQAGGGFEGLVVIILVHRVEGRSGNPGQKLIHIKLQDAV